MNTPQFHLKWRNGFVSIYNTTARLRQTRQCAMQTGAVGEAGLEDTGGAPRLPLRFQPPLDGKDPDRFRPYTSELIA